LYDRKGIIERLSKMIDKNRLKHSLGVSRSAAELAERYGFDKEKAELAGLLHDCAKCLSYDDSIRLCKKYGYEPDSISKSNKALLHAPLGAFIAEDIFEIKDREVLGAIACHTTGKMGMTLLDKIICLADYIEEGRQYPGVAKVRSYAFRDINKALLTALELSIMHVIKRGWLLHPMTIEARNYLLMEIEESKKPHTKLPTKNIE
jgi:predicted HD superfamily hydrolase involved in NAD metabolism